MEHFYNVGKIVNTQGIKGEVRVVATTDFIEQRFRPGSTLYVFVDGSHSPIELTIRSHRTHKQFQIVSFVGYESINDVEQWKGSILKVIATDREALPEGEFYFDQIIGLEAWSDVGERIGTVTGILQPGANDVWIISRDDKSELLLPYIEDCILHVDLPARKVIVHLLEGLE